MFTTKNIPDHILRMFTTTKNIPDHILRRWCRLLFSPIYKWCYKHVFFSKAALCISGLVFSHGMVEFALMKILEDYLAFTWSKKHLAKLTAIINLQDGVSAVSAVIVAHIADSCVGRFNMILLSTLTYITGLVLLGFSTNVGIYVGLLAVALGKSSRDPVLKDFLADQMSGKKGLHKDEERIEDRRKVWWRISWCLGAIIGFFVMQYALWAVTFYLSILAMLASFWIFWIGFFYYYEHDLVQTPLNICYTVFKTAISKRYLSYPSTPHEFHGNRTGGILLSPEVRFFRWLDKAAIKSSGEEVHGMFCTVKEVSDVKRLLTMIPMWTNFIAYSFIKAAGNTFFIEQSNNLKMGDSIGVLFLLQYLVSFCIQIPFRWEKVRQKCGPLMKIGAGMVCSIACCTAAWQVEIRRLYLIKKERIDPDAVDPEEAISMTVYSLLPQFLLLALMETLAGDGLEEFVDDHIPVSMKRYGSAFNECALGFGYFLSIILLLFRSWFGDTINRSHLQRYYLFLVILSSIFFGIYVYLSPMYARMEVIPLTSKNMELLELEDGARDQIEFKPTKSSSSTRWKRLVNVTTATRRFYSALATVKGTQSTTAVQYHESMEEELPLRSHCLSTEDGARGQIEFKPTKSSSSTRWKRLVNVTIATCRFYSPLANVKGMQSTTAVQFHESMEEEFPLRSHYPSTEDEELVPDDEPGSLRVAH